MQRQAHRSRDRCVTGFTLVEVLVVLVVVAILAAVALPAFNDSIRKSRRSDAFTALTLVQHSQERWRANNAAYAALANTAESGDPANGLGLPDTTTGGYYDITLSDIDATGYVATATAVSTKSQADDTACQLMAVRMVGGNVGYGSGASALDWADPARCWTR